MTRLSFQLGGLLAALAAAALLSSCGEKTPSSPLVPGGIILFENGSRGPAEIYGMRSDGTGRWRITRDNFPDAAPQWSPDGREIVFMSYHDTTAGEVAPHPDLFVMRADGRIVRRLTQSNAWYSSPTWSPDGRRIAYDANDPVTGVSRVYVMNADGSDPQPLTSPDRGSWAPDWSPDGTKILYLSLPAEGVSRIYVMRSDGTGAQQIPSDAACALGVFDVEFSPDGSRIAYTCEAELGTTAIFVMNADGTGSSRLTPVSADGSLSYMGATWSPDGRTIAFTRGFFDSTNTFRTDIFSMSASGGEATRLTTDGMSAVSAWGAAR
jgi:Tol biopolymer transport system component